MKEIERCLNCKAESCNGEYPYCDGAGKNYTKKERREYTATKLRQLGRGNATVLVSLLTKLGYNRVEIAKICFSTYGSVDTLIKNGLKNGLLTDEEVEASRIRKRESPSSAK